MKFLERIKYSVYFFLIAIFNLILKFLPFFFLRKIVLQFIGWKIGKNCAIHRGIKITSFKFKCTIGDGTVINKNVLLDNRRGIKIGKNVSISQDAKLYTLGHDYNNSKFNTLGKMIYIEDYVVIFSGAKIMPGVKLEYGSVILPFSLVTKNVKKLNVVGGFPAVKKSIRKGKLTYKFNYKVWFGI